MQYAVVMGRASSTIAPSLFAISTCPSRSFRNTRTLTMRLSNPAATAFAFSTNGIFRSIFTSGQGTIAA